MSCDATCHGEACEFDYGQVDDLIGYVMNAIDVLHTDVVTVGRRVERIEAALGIEDE
jgi:hypothetical protein